MYTQNEYKIHVPVYSRGIMPISHEHTMQQGAQKKIPFTNPQDRGRKKSPVPWNGVEALWTRWHPGHTRNMSGYQGAWEGIFRVGKDKMNQDTATDLLTIQKTEECLYWLRDII